MAVADRTRVSVAGVPIDVLTWSDALERISAWGEARNSRIVCICNAHSVVTARHDPEFSNALAYADMATPDGAPVAWMLRRAGAVRQERINGPDLMWRYCGLAQRLGQPMYLYGGTEVVLEKLRRRLLGVFPSLNIVGWHSPPFRKVSEYEGTEIVRQINESGAAVVWVGLGCPKQEKWMIAHRGSINAVLIGVGAAFDYHAGTLNRAPLWMQRNGLEWLYRLMSEPRRLWRRYLITNSLFIFYAARQLLRRK